MTSAMKKWVIGPLAVIAGLAVYIVLPTADRADLVDAGAAACSPVLVRCEIYNENTGNYRTVQTKALKCGTDLVLPRVPARISVFRVDNCDILDPNGCNDPTACVDGDTASFKADVDRCGCAADPATCTWTGGSPTPKGTTFDPGTWSGAGCVRKPCGEIHGLNTMPGACL